MLLSASIIGFVNTPKRKKQPRNKQAVVNNKDSGGIQ